MPSARSRFAVFDTSVYVENFRTGRFTLRMLQSPLVPRCSSVVLHELLRRARTAKEVGFVRDLLTRCKVVTPTEGQWIHGAEVLRAMRRREHYGANTTKEARSAIWRSTS